MKTPAYGRQMTRFALMGFENPIDARLPLAGYPS
jgi:hypothetical protein